MATSVNIHKVQSQLKKQKLYKIDRDHVSKNDRFYRAIYLTQFKYVQLFAF